MRDWAYRIPKTNSIAPTPSTSTIRRLRATTSTSGYNVRGIPSKITMTVFADVYNKTALPLTTAPSLKNDPEVKNTVNINAGSTINAIRNVNINAESGTEVITESANNSVNIDGTINAGIHNSLKMTISGGKLFTNESENPSVEVTEGAFRPVKDKIQRDRDDDKSVPGGLQQGIERPASLHARFRRIHIA